MKILQVDLGSGSVGTTDFEPAPAWGLGGKALGIALLERHLDPTAAPLSAATPMVLCPSPLSARAFPGSNRLAAFTRSPLTGGWLESYVGGSISRTLRETGWDAVVVTGAAPAPSVLVVDEGGARIEPASDLLDLATDEVEQRLLARLPPRAGVLAAGTAAANLVAFAAVMHEGAHALGRGGFGAVFGSKRLAAIAVVSPGPRPVAVSSAFADLRSQVAKLAADSPGAKKYQAYGTAMMVSIMNEAGAFPTGFFEGGRSPHRPSLEAEGWGEWAEIAHDTCAPCPMRCRKRLRLAAAPGLPPGDEGRELHGPEYETIFAFGGSCGVAQARDIAFLNETCNRLGLDTISAGNLVGMAIKARERAAAKASEVGSDTGLMRLLAGAPAEGDVAGIRALLESIAARSTPLGDLLARGMDAAAPLLGVADLSVTSKGLDPAGYEPRKMPGMALSYALNPRGACHLRSTFYKAELSGALAGLDERSYVETFIDWETRLLVSDSLILCRFYRDFMSWERLAACASELAGETVTVEALRAESLAIAARVSRLNQRLGLGPETDQVAERFYLSGTDTAPPLDRARLERLIGLYRGLTPH